MYVGRILEIQQKTRDKVLTVAAIATRVHQAWTFCGLCFQLPQDSFYITRMKEGF